VHQWKEHTWQSIFIFGLDDKDSPGPAAHLSLDLCVIQMISAHHRKDKMSRYQLLSAIKGMLEHGSGSDEIDVLLWQHLFPKSTDKWLKTLAFATC
jgi:hypothetical protein